MAKSRTIRRAVAIAAAGLLCAGITSPAAADPFGVFSTSTGTGPLADDRFHDFCSIVPWENAWGAPFWDSMVSLEQQTEIDVQHYSSCGGGTDVVGIRGNSNTTGLGPSTRGSHECHKWARTNVCDQGYVRVNEDLLTNYTQRRKTFCHEVGHSLGATHGSAYGGCMVSGASSNITLADHHVQHINAAY